MTLFAVDPYLDQIRIKKEKKWCPIMQRFDAQYFETEAEAKRFIVERAETRVLAAQDALDKAKARRAKCRKKFG